MHNAENGIQHPVQVDFSAGDSIQYEGF